MKTALSFLRKNGLAIIGLGVIIAVYFFQVARYQGWLIDDAGISFAYARNLALGYGLVSQPGVPPVEGFSNPAWVLLLSLFARLGLDIAVIVKPLSLALSILSIGVLYLAILRLTGSKSLALAVLACLAVQPAFVIWSVSGLENPLLAVLLAVLFYLCVLPPTPALAILSGVAAGLTALTRPDAILYLPVYAILHPKYFKQTLLPAIAIWGSYFVFRLFYYGQALPNTYVMKAEGELFSKTWLLEMWGRFRFLMLGLFGPKYLMAAVVLLLVALAAVLLWKRRLDQRYLAAGIFFAISFGSYLFLPTDWMGEYRFATPMLPFCYLLMVLVIADALRLFMKGKFNPNLAASLLLALWLAGMYLVSYAPRLDKFARSPTVNLYGIRAGFYHFTRYAAILGLDHPSILLPDVGGALYYYPETRIVDLGGLVDATIARTLGKDQPAFHDYIFETVKPDFIHVHGGWTYTADLDGDPRFRRDYVAIYEYVDPAMVLQFGGQEYSGDFVRRSLVTPDQLALLESVER